MNSKVKPVYPKQTLSISAEFRERLNDVKVRGVNDEDEWLIAASDFDVDTSNVQTSWTSHHEGKARDKTEDICTINVPQPLINYKSSAIELQYHLMKIAVEYTIYLNPGQMAVGCSDQPLH